MFGFYDSYFLFFGLEVTYYGFLIAVGMALGVFVACKNAKFRGFKSDDIIILACYVLPLSVIGAKLYYLTFSGQPFSFWDIFKIWEAGLAIYGGVIGGALGLVIYCLIHKKNILDMCDIAAPSLILGQAIGRIGCYFAGCCYGIEVTDPSLTWFPLSAFVHGGWHLSTFFYESIWDFATFLLLILLLRKNKVRQRGTIVALYFIVYGTGRAWIEALRGDSLYLGAIKVSQLLSILLIVLGIAIILTTYLLGRKGKDVFVKEKVALVIKQEQEKKIVRQILKQKKKEEKSELAKRKENLSHDKSEENRKSKKDKK